ncbi:MAG: sigma-54 dependent transcriptional regulator [Thermoanaerobaculia bacterium]
MSAGRILVVEDRESLRTMLQRALVQDNYDVSVAEDGAAGIRQVQEEEFDLVLTDLRLPHGSGIEVLRACQELPAGPPVVVLTAYGTVESAVEAMKLGAIDFLEKPVDLDELSGLIKNIVGSDVEGDGFTPPGGSKIVGRHPRLRAAIRLLERVAGTESTVLLRGESGTGKELFARAVHLLSPRSKRPFVAVNCAAIPENLLESELFGHEKGAFTGAHQLRKGRFEQAAGGTLFLDEIGELSPAMQGKVLRVLDQRTFERVGGNRTLHADVRLVAATNRDLESSAAASDSRSLGHFRADLFYRLNVFPIELPPLRDRASDIGLLTRHILGDLAKRFERPLLQLTPAAKSLLSSQTWPGNVRELANVLERAVILSDGPRVGVKGLKEVLFVSVAAAEKEAVRSALITSGGDKRKAATSLGLSYRTLLRRVKKYDLEGVPKYR